MTDFVPERIRILLADLSGLFGQVVKQVIAGQPEMVVVGEVEGPVQVLLAAQGGVDVVLLGVPHLSPAPGVCSLLLNEYPHVKILALATQEEGAVGYWLGVRRCRITSATSETLLHGMRRLHKYTPSV